MNDTILNAEQEGIISKVEKLLALARNNPNENEAQSATEKAMELLAAYNLDMASIGKQTSNRKDQKLKGGLYSWQRELWNAVAQLNFCKYWFIRGLARGQSYEHRILGRVENVASTKVMAEYLQDTIERLATDYGKKAYPGASRFIRELIIYREGMAYRIAERLRELRRQRINEERRKQEEARTRHSHGGFALVLADVIQTEDDLNEDYLHGLEPGTTGKRRAEEKARQAAAMDAYNKRMAEEQAKWDLFAKTNPEEAKRIVAERKRAIRERDAKWAAQDAKRAKAMTRPRKMTRAEERMSSPEFYAGYDKGNEVGLDRQIDGDDQPRLGRR